jgi:transposase
MSGAARLRLGSTGRARGVGTGRGSVRNHKGGAKFVGCVRMVHLDRDFQAMVDRGGESAEVGRTLLGHSERIFDWWHRVRDGTMARATLQSHVAMLRFSFRDDLKRGVECDCAPTAATCRELLAGETHLWTFVRVEGIEPTNNDAERALRHGVIYRKTSGGTDSESGSRFVERMLTVVATCRQRGINVLDYLTGCYQARLNNQPAPSLLQGC